MRDFAAIDFETANFRPTSVCSVGIVVVRNGELYDRFYRLIRPTPNFYMRGFTEIHGLTRSDTDDAPRFPEIWAHASDVIGDLPLVAHNKAFDERCLKSVYAAYDMKYPDYEFHCTLMAARRQLRLNSYGLKNVATVCGYDLENHHHALADAEACAAIAIKLL